MATAVSPVTAARCAHHDAGRDTLRRLLPMLYDDLRRLARRERRRRALGTLPTTGLAHEAYLRLARRPRSDAWNDRGHFLAAAAQAMRHILVDAARRRTAAKRGDGQALQTLDEGLHAAAAAAHAADVLAVDQALRRLAALDDRLCRVVECRFYGGLTEAETAEALGVSARTVHRDWLRARAWLARWLAAPAVAS